MRTYFTYLAVMACLVAGITVVGKNRDSMTRATTPLPFGFAMEPAVSGMSIQTLTTDSEFFAGDMISPTIFTGKVPITPVYYKGSDYRSRPANSANLLQAARPGYRSRVADRGEIRRAYYYSPLFTYYSSREANWHEIHSYPRIPTYLSKPVVSGMIVPPRSTAPPLMSGQTIRVGPPMPISGTAPGSGVGSFQAYRRAARAAPGTTGAPGWGSAATPSVSTPTQGLRVQ